MVLNVYETIALFGGIVFIGFFAEMMFRKFSIPSVIFLLFFGLFLGSFSGVITPENLMGYASLFAPIALIIMLFEGGLNMNLMEFIKETPIAILSSFLFVVIQIIIVAVFCNMVFGWDYVVGAILGALLGGLSSLSITQDPNKILSQPVKNIISIECIATDIFGIVIAITLINITVGIGSFDILLIGKEIITYFVMGILIGGIGALIWAAILKVAGNIDFGYFLTIGFLFILFYLSDLLGGDGSITVLIFGLFLGNIGFITKFFKSKNITPNTFFIRRIHSEITFFITTFFFVYLGTIVAFKNFDNVLLGLIISLLLIIIRFVFVKIYFGSFKFSDKEIKIISSISARDLSAAILAPLPFSYGIMGTENFSEIAFSVIVFTVIFTTLSYIYVTKFGKVELSEKIAREEQIAKEEKN